MFNRILHLLVISFITVPGQPEPDGRRFREILADKFSDGSLLMGGAISTPDLATEQGVVLAREFNYVTPENDFKHQVTHRGPEEWNWTRADAWLDYIEEHDQVLRMHGPISPQVSTWAKEDGRTAQDLETDLRLWVRTLCQRYNDNPRITHTDVVNEVVHAGAWHRDKPGTADWENPWYKVGLDTDDNGTPLYIKYAFEEAVQHCPDTKLVINQHGAFTEFELIKTLVMYLRERDLRVDGIGWQAHIRDGPAWNTPENRQALGDLIDWAHGIQLEFHVTETDVWVDSPADFEAQALVYKAILDELIAKRYGGVVTWNCWNLGDANAWQSDFLPTLFHDDLSAKPAYYALQASLEAAIPMSVTPKILTPQNLFDVGDWFLVNGRVAGPGMGGAQFLWRDGSRSVPP